jgi:uncharacterized protein YbaP (TraB family)
MKLPRLLAKTATGLALLLTGACAAGPAGLSNTPPPGAIAGPALWQVSDADTTIYLFGTVHALPKDKQWMDARISRAFEAADELVTEIDVSNAAASAQALQRAGMLPEGQSLRAMMTEENRQQFDAALVTLGVPVTSLDKMEPWLAAMTMTLLPLLRSGYDQQSGVEMALNGQPGERKHGALETVEQQIALFDTMPIEAQLAFLDSTVEELDKASISLDQMVAEWLEGDAEGLAKLLNSELDDPVLYKRLLTDRNANWAEWIDQRMNTPGTVFIAVGAGHLAGPDSVQAQLTRRGMKVQRVWQ